MAQLGNEYLTLKKLVDDHVLDYFPKLDERTKVLSDSMEYSVTAGGKRLRSVLLLSFYKMAEEGADPAFALPFAAAVEYIQTYSLIHDDLPSMDNDDYRRGKLTNHKVFGEDMALLAGDALQSLAFETMLCDADKCEDAVLKARKVKAAYEIAKGTGTAGMVQGQVADVKTVSQNCDYETLRFIDANKTGAFIKSSILAGCFLGGADKTLTDAAALYGDCIGEAFQIVDDILDIISNVEELGKNTGVDAQLNKSTYPALLGLDNAKKRVDELLDTADNAIAAFDKYGIARDITKFLRDEIN